MYDTVPGTCSVPDWIAETVDTRNVVQIRLGVREKLRSLISHCTLYKNDEEGFMQGGGGGGLPLCALQYMPLAAPNCLWVDAVPQELSKRWKRM